METTLLLVDDDVSNLRKKIESDPSVPKYIQTVFGFLFDRFYRVEESRSRNTGGMGLGLAIAKEFVEAHQRSISVQSEVGRGTQYYN